MGWIGIEESETAALGRTSPFRDDDGRVSKRRTAAARRQAEAFLERPIFGIKRPFSNVWGIRGPRGGHISIQRRRRDAEGVCDLSHADVGIGEHRLGCLDVVVGKFWRTASGAARAAGGGKAGLSALTDQTALEFRQCAEHVKNQPPLRGRRVERFGPPSFPASTRLIRSPW